MSTLSEDKKYHSWKVGSFPITLEPAGFLLFSALTLRQIVYQNLYLSKTCRVNFQFNATQCETQNLQSSNNETINYQDESNQVQGFVSSFLIYTALLENLPGVFFVLFLGPWSNEHGRKPLMISPILGFTLMTIIMMANLHFESWPVEYTLLGSLIFGLSGGGGSFFMASSSYMADISSEETRTFRMSMYTGIAFVSMPISSFVGIYLLKSGGEWAVWSTTLGLLILGLGYLTFFVIDSRGKTPRNDDSAELRNSKPGNLSSVMKNLRQCFSTTFKRRTGNVRACILALLAINCLTMFLIALGNVVYLYTRVKFSWDASDYAQYLTVSSLVPALGALVLVPVLSGYFKLNDGILGLVSLIGLSITNAMVGFANAPVMMYLSTITSALESGIDVVIRSTLSKLVEGEELGHLFSFMACTASIMPLILSPTVKLIYKSTLSVFPGCVFVVGISLNVISIILLAYVATTRFIKKDERTGFSSCFQANGTPEDSTSGPSVVEKHI